MKKTLLLLTIILCASATVLSQNLLTNGSFEDFTENEDGTIVELGSEGAPSTTNTLNAWGATDAGRRSVRLSNQSPQDGAKSIYWREGQRGPINQQVELTAGKHYRASVWVKWSAGAFNSTPSALLRVDDGEGVEVARVELNGMETAWTKYTVEFTASGTIHRILINRFGKAVEHVGEMHVDNVELIEVDPSSTKSILGGNFNFYPNPFNDILHIYNAVGIKTASITNLAGQVIKTQEINSSNDQSIINTSSLEKGVYLLQVTGKQGEAQTVKLIKH